MLCSAVCLVFPFLFFICYLCYIGFLDDFQYLSFFSLEISVLYVFVSMALSSLLCSDSWNQKKKSHVHIFSLIIKSQSSTTKKKQIFILQHLICTPAAKNNVTFQTHVTVHQTETEINWDRCFECLSLCFHICVPSDQIIIHLHWHFHINFCNVASLPPTFVFLFCFFWLLLQIYMYANDAYIQV